MPFFCVYKIPNCTNINLFFIMIKTVRLLLFLITTISLIFMNKGKLIMFFNTSFFFFFPQRLDQTIMLIFDHLLPLSPLASLSRCRCWYTRIVADVVVVSVSSSCW